MEADATFQACDVLLSLRALSDAPVSSLNEKKTKIQRGQLATENNNNDRTTTSSSSSTFPTSSSVTNSALLKRKRLLEYRAKAEIKIENADVISIRMPAVGNVEEKKREEKDILSEAEKKYQERKEADLKRKAHQMMQVQDSYSSDPSLAFLLNGSRPLSASERLYLEKRALMEKRGETERAVSVERRPQTPYYKAGYGNSTGSLLPPGNKSIHALSEAEKRYLEKRSEHELAKKAKLKLLAELPRKRGRFMWPEFLHKIFIGAIFDIGLSHVNRDIISEMMQRNREERKLPLLHPAAINLHMLKMHEFRLDCRSRKQLPVPQVANARIEKFERFEMNQMAENLGHVNNGYSVAPVDVQEGGNNAGELKRIEESRELMYASLYRLQNNISASNKKASFPHGLSHQRMQAINYTGGHSTAEEESLASLFEDGKLTSI